MENFGVLIKQFFRVLHTVLHSALHSVPYRAPHSVPHRAPQSVVHSLPHSVPHSVVHRAVAHTQTSPNCSTVSISLQTRLLVSVSEYSPSHSL